MDSYPLHIGDSGWRAVYTEGLTLERLSAIVLSLADLYPLQKCLIGYDNRFLSKEFAEHSANLLSSMGWQVDVINKLFPTPGIALLTKKLNYQWGLVITASHNPYYYNGLKILNQDGLLSERSLNQKLEEMAQQKMTLQKFPGLFSKKDVSTFTFSKAATFYLSEISKHISVKTIQKASLKIVWDSFSGTTTPLFPIFLKKLKIRGKGLEWPEDPSFGHRRLEPDESSLVTLRKMLLKSRAKIGIATDLDGDRFAVLDENGRFILPNVIGPLMTWYLLEIRKETGTVYQTVSASELTRHICEKFGSTCVEMPVGFQVMGKKMLENPKALLGMEETGGIAYAPHLCFKDGLMAHALLLEMLASQKKKLSELIHDLYKKFGKYHYHRVDLPLQSLEEKTKWVDRNFWEKQIGEKIIHTSTLDGEKYYFPSGWLLIRSSKTEPLLRIYFESKQIKFVQKIKAIFYK